MSRNNSLILLLCFVVVFFIILSKTIIAQNTLEENTKQLAKAQMNAKTISEVKKLWDNNTPEAKLRSIFQNAEINKFNSASAKISINIEKISLNQARDSLNKILNEPIKIENMEINRIDDENVSISLEVVK